MKSTLKKSLFFAAWCVAFLFGTVAFHSCSNEDLDEDSVQSKAELFRAKAKELSKKYGVDVTLNEENIEGTVQEITLEQLEKEIQMFASIRLDTIHIPADKPHTVKKLRFSTNKKLREEINRNKKYEGSFTQEKNFTLDYTYRSRTGAIRHETEKYVAQCETSWCFQLQGNCNVNAKIDLYGTPSASGSDKLNYSYSISGEKLSFTASGNVTVSSSRYTIKLYCVVDYNEDGNKSFNFSKS